MKAAGEGGLLEDFILVGEVGCGKTALMKALLQHHDEVRKTQAAVYHPHNVIDTPGEFSVRPSYYGALLATVVEVDTVIYLQPANSERFSLPAGLLQVYPDKRVIGVISKADLPDANLDRARRILQENAIAEPYFVTSAMTDDGVDQLRSYLLGLHTDSEDATPDFAVRGAA